MIYDALLKLIRDDDGQDLVEYALLSGAIGLTGVAAYPLIAEAMGGTFVTWESAAQAISEPCAPGHEVCP